MSVNPRFVGCSILIMISVPLPFTTPPSSLFYVCHALPMGRRLFLRVVQTLFTGPKAWRWGRHGRASDNGKEQRDLQVNGNDQL